MRSVGLKPKAGSIAEKERFDVLKCAWCGKYYDKGTKKYVEKPAHGVLMSHGLCKPCLDAEMKKLEVMEL